MLGSSLLTLVRDIDRVAATVVGQYLRCQLGNASALEQVRHGYGHPKVNLDPVLSSKTIKESRPKLLSGC